ncbi:Pesticin receptor [termite gut metagenome]|uniref:Pesticin receptor n=1 Tax=termite gut metagenome TaxID=433724 RepID=A0A5J4T0D7_9ZZZZ
MKKYIFIFAWILPAVQSMANILPADSLQQDTLKTINIEEVVVFGNPKGDGNLREQPLSVTLMSQENMRAKGVTSMKDLTALVPNIFIPDYGSKLTSAIYIRGVGSRMNTPAVGLYVDNIPYIDKSAYDFSYTDIDSISVLRGPQGTLYGRSAMGGLIRIYTKSPFNYQGIKTDMRLSMATHDNYNVSLTRYQHTSDKFAFSMGGFYEHAGGFYNNTFLNKRIDHVDAGGGRVRAIYFLSTNLKFDLNLNYEYSDQGGYAYSLSGKKAEISIAPAYNDESGYRRGLINAGLNMEYSGTNFTFNSITGFQHLNDRMAMDNDFSPANVFFGIQHQNQNTLTEEIVLKNRNNHRWEWVTGAFGFYQQLKTTSSITFKEDALKETQRLMDRAYEGSTSSRKIIDDTMLVSGLYDTPVLGAALYHQSTFNDVLFKNLSLIFGLRLDYEQTKLAYNTQAPLRTKTFQNETLIKEKIDDYGVGDGEGKNSFSSLLPKFAGRYSFDKGNNIYISAGRGYRSGGYNIQMFPESIQDRIINAPDSPIPNEILPQIHYKPEYSWNYELGTHLTLWQNKLLADIAMFYTRIEDQQIPRFVKSGLGRAVVNAGQSRSYGMEVTLQANLTDALSFNVNYGYTQATLMDYVTNTLADNGSERFIDYSGNHVPFVPEQTFSLSGQYAIKFNADSPLDVLQFYANYTGIGKIYWTEYNDVMQKSYGTLNGRISALMGNTQVDLWARNALNKKYATFYFESFGKGFAQAGKPLQIGIDVRLTF